MQSKMRAGGNLGKEFDHSRITSEEEEEEEESKGQQETSSLRN